VIRNVTLAAATLLSLPRREHKLVDSPITPLAPAIEDGTSVN